MVQYILECIAFQLLFLTIYDLFLKRETFFQWNRFYLIGTYVLSLFLPWIKIEAMKTTVPETFHGYSEILWNTNELVVNTIIAEERTFSIQWEYVLLFGGMLLATLFFGYKLYQIFSLRRKGQVSYFKDFTQIIISNSAMAFSFFKSIFLGDKIADTEYQSILAHELVHIRQRHSYDLLFFELMRIVCWFNPLVYVYQRRVSELHEFIADAQVAKTNKKAQYEFLLSQVFQTQNISFINQFFKSSLIKKRIVMLQKSKSKKIYQLKYLLLVPLVFGMLAYTSAAFKESESITQATNIEDAKLIKQIETEIEQQVTEKGSLDKVYFDFFNEFRGQKNQVLNKREYFKSELIKKRFYEEMKVVFDENRKPIRSFEIPLPSTKRYENHKRRIEAFQILDDNLKYSILAYKQDVYLIEDSPILANEAYIFEVANVKDFTGKELRALNNKMSEIFEETDSKYEYIILTDSTYIFKIDGTDKNSELEMLLRNKTFPFDVIGSDTLRIQEVKNSSESFALETDPVPYAIVEEVPIFPGCEDADNKRKCFNEMMQKHIAKNFSYPKEAEEKGIQGRVSIMFTISKKGKIESLRMRGPNPLLEKEVERIIKKLPKMKPGKHKGKKVDVPFSIPVNFRLDSENDFEKLSESLSKESSALIAQHNQLVLERKRLLKNSNESNPIIVNLDQRIKELRQLLEYDVRREVEAIEHLTKPNKDKSLESDELLKEYLEQQLDTTLKDRTQKFIQNRIKELSESSSNQNDLKNKMYQKLDVVPFAIIDNVPVFPGCEDADNKRKCFNEMMQKHISKNFNYPIEAQEKGIQGRVAVMFTIGKDGPIKNIRKRGPDVLLENEAVRIIEKLPKMKPGKHKGKKVDVPFSIPITFKLNDNDISETSFDLSKFIGKTTLLIIDGEEYMGKLNHVDKDKIESMKILEDEAAIKKYGKKGKNGVVEITTKKND